MKKVVIACLLALAAPIAAAAANDDYVEDRSLDNLLHDVEDAWNDTFTGAGKAPDVSGSVSDITLTAESDDGRTTVTLAIDNLGLDIDFGRLDFDPMNPIREKTCYFDLHVNAVDVWGGGQLVADTNGSHYEIACNSVRAGIEKFTLSGTLKITSHSISIPTVTLDARSTDYSLELDCDADAASLGAYAPTDAAASSAVSDLLLKWLSNPDSKFNQTLREKIAKQAKKAMKKLM